MRGWALAATVASTLLAPALASAQKVTLEVKVVEASVVGNAIDPQLAHMEEDFHRHGFAYKSYKLIETKRVTVNLKSTTEVLPVVTRKDSIELFTKYKVYSEKELQSRYVILSENYVKQVTIGPLIERTIAKGTLVYTDEYDIDSRLVEWGYDHETVCHAAGEFARDDDGDGFCEVHVNTLEGFWSLLRSWLRPHRGIPQESLPLYLGFFEFVHNARASGKRLLGALIGQLLTPPRNPS